MAATELRETKTNQSAPLIFFTWNRRSAEVLANLIGSSEAIQINTTIAFMEEEINCDTRLKRISEIRMKRRRAEDCGVRPG